MKYGLIGEKLSHSYSKIIHEQLLENYTYEIHPLKKDELEAFMNKKEFNAINVTIPYKQDVIPYLDEMSEAAKSIQAVNTIVNRDGKLIGYNTDYLGFKYTLDHHDIQIQDKKVLVMGNGGASQAIQAVLKDDKASEVIVVDLKVEGAIISLEEAYEKHLDCEVIINTTPVGMYPNVDGVSVDISKFKKCSACIDAVYNPLRTDFVLSAQGLGIKGINGLEMLVAQAKYALEFFKDIQIDDVQINRIYKEILLETSNIVFIGMPSCGKTTIGKRVAKQLNKQFIDIDAEIVKRIEMPIADYFTKYGEAAFRKVESEVCKEIATKTNTVISCGGGVIKNDKNIWNLKRNGMIIYIQRDVNDLQVTSSRPLSSSVETIQKLFEEREPLYKRAMDETVLNNVSLKEVVNKTIKVYIDNIEKINK